MATLILQLAENDRNGNETGKATAVRISDAIELEPGLWCGGVSVRRQNGSLWIGRLKMPLFGWREWYGNMMWNGARIGVHDAARVLNYLSKNGWHNTGGWVELAEKYKGQTVTAGDLRDAQEDTD